MQIKKSFASDNNSGIHPMIMEAIELANNGHSIGYGDDFFTKEAEDIFRKHLQKELSVYFLGTGTAANIIALQAFINSFNSVICSKTSHINVDECGAFEKFTGAKTEIIPSYDGKIKIEDIEEFLHFQGDPHHSQPKIISISQPTELGTVYTTGEINKICDFAHRNNMFVHVDGARIANACVSLGIDLCHFFRETDIDVVSFGGTKNGLFMAEAILYFPNRFNQNIGFQEKIDFYRKQGMQLISKMRFITAQYKPYFQKKLWKENALKSNTAASYLKDKIHPMKELKVCYPVQTNALFVAMPQSIIKPLQDIYFFYVWQKNYPFYNEKYSIIRLMTSFDTGKDDMDNFLEELKSLLKNWRNLS